MERVFLCIISLLVIFISRWVYRWRNPKINNNRKLPPGTTGFPLIGETLEFLRPHDFYEINPFIRTRMERYGPIFKTNLLGLPAVVSTDPELNHYIFQQEDKLFRIRYTESFRKIFGDDNIMKYHGSIHKYLKNLILNLVSPQRLKDKLVAEMDAWMRQTLSSWTHRPSVNIREAAADMIFEYVALKLFSYDESKEKMNLRSNYINFMNGLISFPINIPGTTYHACIRGRRTAMKMIQDKYEERVASKECRRNDFLDILIDELDKEDTFLNKASIIELLFVLLFGAYETTSQTIALIVKFITENPSVLTKLTEEHEEILKVRATQGADADQFGGVTWEEYKSMSFTHMVINETLRLANIAPALFRIATQDVNIKGRLHGRSYMCDKGPPSKKIPGFVPLFGYTIPEGWMVLIIPGVAHLDPNNFENPLKFNPWRWEKEQDVHAASRNFMPFGGGLRHCVGADFAKVEIAVFIHYLATKWKIIGGGQPIRAPGLTFPNGLHVQIWNKVE